MNFRVIAIHKERPGLTCLQQGPNLAMEWFLKIENSCLGSLDPFNTFMKMSMLNLTKNNSEQTSRPNPKLAGQRDLVFIK